MSSQAINGVSGNSPAFSSNLNTTNRANGNERDMFMTLLVAQLKNQDPLQPQDGSQFVAQLAQFNSLDQLVGIRQLLERMNTPTDASALPAGNANSVIGNI